MGTALVTGAAGFIGSSLVARLLEEGFERVIGLDSFTDYYDVALKKRNLGLLTDSRFQIFRTDINDIAQHSAELSQVTHVFHEAGQPGVRASWGQDFREYTHANVDGTQALLEFARGLPNLEAFLYASSSSVYGEATQFPTREDALPMPRSPYGVTKLAGEHLCAVYAATFGLPTRSLRYFTVYGPRQRPDMAFTRFLTAVLKGEPITIFGDGHQLRDFTYIDDVIAANLMVADADLPPGSVHNVAGGSSASVREVVAALEEIASQRIKISYLEQVDGDVRQTGGDTKRIREDVGWSPKIAIFEGLTMQWQWATEALAV